MFLLARTVHRNLTRNEESERVLEIFPEDTFSLFVDATLQKESFRANCMSRGVFRSAVIELKFLGLR